MKIIEKDTEFEREVYALYWSDFQGKSERYHCIIPADENYPGFISVPETECEVVDESIRNFVIVKTASGSDMLVHPILKREHGLFDRLIDHDPDAMAEFSKYLKDEYRNNESYLVSPPLDMLHKSSKHPLSSDQDGDYYFCPSCYEANQKFNDYDEAIKCPKCLVVYNCST